MGQNRSRISFVDLASIDLTNIDRRSFLALFGGFGAAAATGAIVGCSSAPAATQTAADKTIPVIQDDVGASAGQGGSASATGSARPAGSGNSAGSEGFEPTGKVAVVYFSVPLTDSQSRDADSGASIVMSGDQLFGNVQYAAQFVAAAAGADVFRISTETPYPTDDAIFDYALAEQNRNDRPQITLVAPDGSTFDSLDAYETVLVGYPIWWYELPMPLYTFFENYDLSGKRVALFVVHGGSGFSGTMEDVVALQPEAQVDGNGLSISRSVVAEQAAARADEWVSALGLGATA